MNTLTDNFGNKIFKCLLLFLVIFPVMLFINTGFMIDPYWKVIQAAVLVLMLTITIIWPSLRITLFLVSVILIIIMAILYVLRFIEWADIIGSSGIGFIIINLSSYLPQLIKLGYIKNL